MTLHQILKTAEKFTADNSPTILTALGVVGTLTTAVLSAKAGVESAHILSEESPMLTRKEKVQLTWKVWVLPASVGTITCTSIIFANKIGTRRAAAMATAYVLSESAFDEYKHKVAERFGETKERDVRDDVARDRVNRTDSSQVVIGDGKVLCFDQPSGRYFQSTVETIKKAVNDTNYQIIHDGYASMTDFYQRVDLPATSLSEELGWRMDEGMDVLFSTVMSDDGKPCVSIDFKVNPVRNYHKFL